MASMTKIPKLDQIDLKILAALQSDGRITNQSLADKVGLSPSPCLERVRRLEAAGYIAGYGAVVDVEKLYGAVTIFAEITLDEHGTEVQSQFEDYIASVPEIVECFEVSGKRDYLARFVCPDVKSYQALSACLLDDPDMPVKHISSLVVLRGVKPFSGVPVRSGT